MISHSVPVDPRDPKPLLAALLAALTLTLLLSKEQMDALATALNAAPALLPYAQLLLPHRNRGNYPR